jgi:hypothetical protein
MKKLYALLFVVLIAPCCSAQLFVEDSLSNAELSQLLEGFNLDILNISVNCNERAMGRFSGISEMPITDGLILSTGFVDSVAGPATSFLAGSFFSSPGDADLQALVGGAYTDDACVLEFDCIPFGDTLLFNFAFGSEEYPEFVGSQFNDVFAIWLSGPGMSVPVNVAALSDGTPVAINNVNAGVNSAFFYDNLDPIGQHIAFNGFTSNLVAFAAVEPDETYHFKIGIADVLDGVWDSGVFLEAFSFRSTNLTTSVEGQERMGLRLIQRGDELTVMIPEGQVGSTLEVLSSTGQSVQRTVVQSDRFTMSTAELGSGAYVIRMVGATTMVPVRFVKE